VSNVTSLGYMKTLDEIFDESVKIISFIDIGGSDKSSKLLARGLCSQFPDYVILVVNPITGIGNLD